VRSSTIESWKQLASCVNRNGLQRNKLPSGPGAIFLTLDAAHPQSLRFELHDFASLIRDTGADCQRRDHCD
jgi:hypothetical protein